MTVSDDFAAEFSPWYSDDLDIYVRAFASMLEHLALYIEDQDEVIPPLVSPVNQVVDPSFEYDALGSAPPDIAWGLGQFDIEVVQNPGKGQALRLTSTALAARQQESLAALGYSYGYGFPVVENQDYTWALEVNRLAQTGTGSFYLRIDWYDVDSNLVSSSTPQAGSRSSSVGAVGQTNRDYVTAISPANAVAGLARVIADGGANGGSVDVTIDQAMFVQGSLIDYFDGDMDGYEWLGLRGMSTSRMIPVMPMPGWAIMLDPDTAPKEALPFLAQFVGERIPMGISEDAARQWIRDAPNQIRGTATGIARAAQRKLTGTKTVMLRPRTKSDGTEDSDYLTIMTFASETPNEEGTLEDILQTVQADLKVEYSIVDSVAWSDVAVSDPTWQDVQNVGRWYQIGQQATAGAGWLVYTA